MENRSGEAVDTNPAFLDGGGEMGALIRNKNWSSTSLGPQNGWPAELRTVIRVMLTTNHPVFIFWGPELRCFYNDAYSRSLGPEKHPSALKVRGRDVWDEISSIHRTVDRQRRQRRRGDLACRQPHSRRRHGRCEDGY